MPQVLMGQRVMVKWVTWVKGQSMWPVDLTVISKRFSLVPLVNQAASDMLQLIHDIWSIRRRVICYS